MPERWFESKKEPKYELSDGEAAAIKELHLPIEKIIKELLPNIERGEYSVILGDDASGRIPTLIIGEIIEAVYKDRDMMSPLIKFIAGSTFFTESELERHTKQRLVQDHIAKIKKEVNRNDWKALIVTDTIDLGRSMDVLMKGLQENGLTADIATIGIVTSSSGSNLESKWGTKVVCGMFGKPMIYSSAIFGGGGELSGVRKNPKDLFSTPLKEHKSNQQEIQRKLNKARALAHEIAVSIIAKYRDDNLENI